MTSTAPHILLVEDDRDIQIAMQEILEEEGFAVTLAHNGQVALVRLAALPRLPDVIVLDLMMPVMDGYEFRRQMQLIPAYSAVPVVVVSADRNAQSKTQQMNVAAFLKKPISLNALLETLAAIFEQPT